MATRFRYAWESERARYRDLRTGRFVAPETIRRALDATLRNLRTEVRSLADDVRAGRLSRTQWALEMRQRVRDVHLLSAASARGGWANMDDAAYGQVGAAVREQNAFLEDFIADVLDGRQPLDGRFTQRAGMYVESGRTTHERARRDLNQDRGMTEERNILRDAAHCGECPALTDLGWVPIGTLPLPGQRECVTGCRCFVETR